MKERENFIKYSCIQNNGRIWKIRKRYSINLYIVVGNYGFEWDYI